MVKALTVRILSDDYEKELYAQVHNLISNSV